MRTRAILRLQRAWLRHVRPRKMFQFKRATAFVRRWMKGKVRVYLEAKKAKGADLLTQFLRDYKHGAMNKFASNVVKASRTLQRGDIAISVDSHHARGVDGLVLHRLDTVERLDGPHLGARRRGRRRR